MFDVPDPPLSDEEYYDIWFPKPPEEEDPDDARDAMMFDY